VEEEKMLDNYPKTFNLKDGTSIILRPMTRDDEHDIYLFFSSLPEETRRYLRNDVTNRKIIAGWMRELNYDITLPILAEHEGNIIAITTLHRQTFGWGRHVGEVRVVLRPDFQGRGLGSLLFQEICVIAVTSGLKKLVARIVTAREDAIKVFEKSGFKRIAVLKGYVKDINRNYADIAIMVKDLVSGTSACE